MLLQLPEGVGIQDWVVPAILPRSISYAGLLELDERADGGVEGGVVLDTGIWDEGDGEVGMVVRCYDLWSRCVVAYFFRSVCTSQQVTCLLNFLFREVLS